MTTKTESVSVDLPLSLKAAIERWAVAGGTSVNQFLVMAAAEKLAALQPAADAFAPARERADIHAAIRFLGREGGEPHRPGDEPPADAPSGAA